MTRPIQPKSPPAPRRRTSWREKLNDDKDLPRVGGQTAKFTIRDNLSHRRDIERAYLAAICTARREILIANAYFFPGYRFIRA